MKAHKPSPKRTSMLDDKGVKAPPAKSPKNPSLVHPPSRAGSSKLVAAGDLSAKTSERKNLHPDVLVRREVGRPKKEAPPRKNISDASHERIKSYVEEILKLLKIGSVFRKYFVKLTQEQQVNLAIDLAHELAFIPAMQGLMEEQKSESRGPKQKKAQAMYLTQVRLVLEKYKVKIPLWKNGSGECYERIDFCTALARATNTPNLHISWRTVALAPRNGFTTLKV